MRYADPPHETVGSISALLHQPSHLVNLVVQPIHSRITSSLSQDEGADFGGAGMISSLERRDPYCVFREKYCRSKTKSKRSGSIRDKYDSMEMNRLASQLGDVNICLQRTQRECELIEKRCTRKVEETPEDNSDCNSGVVRDAAKIQTMQHRMSSSSYNSDSGKGSLTDAEALEGVAEVGEEVDCEPTERLTQSQDATDKEVERLLQIARRLTQQVQRQHQKKGEGLIDRSCFFYLKDQANIPL